MSTILLAKHTAIDLQNSLFNGLQQRYRTAQLSRLIPHKQSGSNFRITQKAFDTRRDILDKNPIFLFDLLTF